MKRVLFALTTLFLLALIQIVVAGQPAITEDGRRVLLKDDGTWQYVKEENQQRGNVPQQSAAVGTIVGAILGVIAGVIVGLLVNSLRDWRKARKELRNTKSILFEEMVENYRKINRWMPRDEKGEIEIGPLVSTLGHLSFSVYDKYFDRLSKLKEQERQAIRDAYEKTRSAVGIAESDSYMLSSCDYELGFKAAANNILRNCKVALEAIEKALKLFPKGKQTLEALQKERGSGLKESREMPA